APFFAEVTATNKPERAEREGEEENGCSRVSMRRVLARRASLHRGYFSRVLRMQVGVSYNYCGEETCLFVAASLRDACARLIEPWLQTRPINQHNFSLKRPLRPNSNESSADGIIAHIFPFLRHAFVTA